MLASLIVLGVFDDPNAYLTPLSRTVILPAVRRPMRLPSKFAAEFLDYKIDWTARLVGDPIISAAAATLSGEVFTIRCKFDATSTSFWLSGGRAENRSLIQILITTAAGRREEEILPITCF